MSYHRHYDAERIALLSRMHHRDVDAGRAMGLRDGYSFRRICATLGIEPPTARTERQRVDRKA